VPVNVINGNTGITTECSMHAGFGGVRYADGAFSPQQCLSVVAHGQPMVYAMPCKSGCYPCKQWYHPVTGVRLTEEEVFGSDVNENEGPSTL
jgi:hypothetical protein